jgi:hypothetical protein
MARSDACATFRRHYTAGMQSLIRILLLITCLPLVGRAQVTVELVFNQEQFLRNESLPVRLKISNFSGQTLRLGGHPGWLSFAIEAHEGRSPARIGEIPMPKTFAIESSKTVSLQLDLMPYFELSEPGRYTLTAKVEVPQLEKEVAAAPKTFDIISGTRLWEKEVGIPGTTPPVVRKYALQQATFLKQMRLYARVTGEEETRVIRVLPLGVLLSFSNPEALVDRSSNLHVLFQNGPFSFLYSVVTPDAEQIIRQTFDYSKTRPRLTAEEDGRVLVIGGQRKVSASDLPPPREADPVTAVEPK